MLMHMATLSSEQAALLPLLQQLSSNNISSSSANIANDDKAQHLSTSLVWIMISGKIKKSLLRIQLPVSRDQGLLVGKWL